MQETWRPDKEEIWRTWSGHLVCGAGGVKGRSGVASVLNKRLAKGITAFHAVSDQLAALDFNLFDKKCHVIVIYIYIYAARWKV